MVNCKNCGAPLSLEDAVCPHCGTPNPEAQEHLRKLAQLDKEFNKTRKEVVQEVSKTRKGYNLLIILVMLLLANLALFIMNTASYEIAESITAKSVDIDEIKANMNEYLENREYTKFVMYYDRFEIRYRDFEEYYPVYYAAYNYESVMKSLSNYLYEKDSYTDQLVKTCQYIVDYEDDYTRELKRDISAFTRKHLTAINEEFELYIKTHLKLTDEDIATIKDLSSSQLLILVSGRMNNEE